MDYIAVGINIAKLIFLFTVYIINCSTKVAFVCLHVAGVYMLYTRVVVLTAKYITPTARFLCIHQRITDVDALSINEIESDIQKIH